jgi:RNA 3'-terminal phosphate cyclase (ATP)
MGAKVESRLERPGFFPAGGGSVVVEIEPVASLQQIELMERGPLVRRSVRAVVSNLPVEIAEREIKVIRRRLSLSDNEVESSEVHGAQGPGNVASMTLEYENVCEVFTSFGQIGRPAETVAKSVAKQCERYLKSSAPVGEYLTDQLMLPMALAGGGAFRSTGMSGHAETHLELIGRFLDVRQNVEVVDRNDVLVGFA